MSRLVFLGAGASIAAGIPGAVEMTDTYLDLARRHFKEENDNLFAQVLGFAVGGLLQRAWRDGRWIEDGPPKVDVESLFGALRMLRDRDSLEAAAFVGAWLPDVEQLDRLATEAPDSDEDLEGNSDHVDHASRIIRGLPPKKSFEFSERVRKALALNGKAFDRTLNWMLAELPRLTSIQDDSCLAYFRSFVQIAHSSGTRIATLNYDNAIEKSCELEGLQCSTGLLHWPRSFQLMFPENAVHLLKLHGSITWAPVEDELRLPWENRVVVPLGTIPTVVFGAGNKLKADGPFLDMLSQLKRWLFDGTEELIVVGYSFRDHHINTIFDRWLSGHNARQITVCAPNARQLATRFDQSISSRVISVEATAEEFLSRIS